MNYASAINYIHNANGDKQDLYTMRALLHAIGNPERDFHAIHVAGTNGKGSICAFLHAMLRDAQHKTGLYTSPYLQRYNERIRLMGAPIEDEELAELITEIAEHVEHLGIHPTPFELGTALAFLYFSRHRVDIAIIEVGLGGRLDSTNALTPIASVIGNISYDHTEYLGTDIRDIAAEKAGIIKSNIPTILYPQCDAVREVVREVCNSLNSNLVDLADFDIHVREISPKLQRFDVQSEDRCILDLAISMPGQHQIKNAATAIATLDTLALVDLGSIQDGLRRAWWPGRLEWADNVLLDGAHNPQGVHALVDYLEEIAQPESTVLIVGITRNKDAREMAREMASLADTIIVTQANNPMAAHADEIAEIFRDLGKNAVAADNISTAIQQAKALSPAHIVITGSLYIVGEARDALGLTMRSIP